jgi:hypothetical protein
MNILAASLRLHVDLGQGELQVLLLRRKMQIVSPL